MSSLPWVACLCLAMEVCAQTALFPLREIKPGMRGTGRTVFAGDRIEEFQVRILGVMENSGPKQAIILARLEGGLLETAGVMQGMSGSPVYINGRLVGAVALAFPFSKEPIAGIRPIEEMLNAGVGAGGLRAGKRVSLFDQKLDVLENHSGAGGKLVDIATPVSFAGFTEAAVEHFAPQLRALGLEPRQGLGGGASRTARTGVAARLEPGSMISVQLIRGDLEVGADGTVTHIEGNRIFAFGHRFLAVGPAEFPFARAEVLTVLPTLSSSFKISTAREWLGTITDDRSTAIAGELGKRAAMVPVEISVNRTRYRMEMVQDRYLTPLLLQIATYSAIDATERSVGAATLAVRGSIRFQDGTAPIRLSTMYAGDWNLAMQASLGAAIPLAYAMQGGFEGLRLKGISLEIEASPEKRQWQIEQVWASRPWVRAGEILDVSVLLTGENGRQMTRQVSYRVPGGASAGPLYITVADGTTTNLADYQLFVAQNPRSAARMVATVNALRGNAKAYVRVWRPEPAFVVGGEDLPDPPPSVAMVLGRAPALLAATPGTRGSKMAEIEIPVDNAAVSGSKTLQVDIRE
jgi:hypothetical protein